jgi:uncharacterized protein (DUF736 family)
MRIAIGKKSELGLHFDVDIPGLAPFPLDLVRNDNAGQNQPAWHAQYRGDRCAAFWKKTSQQSGEEFLSGQLESPVFPGGRLDVAIFSAKDEKGRKDMTWRYRPAEEKSAPAQKSATTTEQAPAERGAQDDDDIPF